MCYVSFQPLCWTSYTWAPRDSNAASAAVRKAGQEFIGKYYYFMRIIKVKICINYLFSFKSKIDYTCAEKKGYVAFEIVNASATVSDLLFLHTSFAPLSTAAAKESDSTGSPLKAFPLSGEERKSRRPTKRERERRRAP